MRSHWKKYSRITENCHSERHVFSDNRQYGPSQHTDYRSVMPINLCGPGDKYNRQNSHVIPAMTHHFHEVKVSNAESVVIWGTGIPMREFLCVDDIATASDHD